MKTLFFSPHSAVWQHSFPEALVAECLQQNGHEVIYVGCGGLLSSYCISMSAFGIPFDALRSKKERVCKVCKSNDKILRSNFGFSGPQLSDLVEENDISIATELASNITKSNFLEFTVDGIAVGKLALYELLLDAKKNKLEFTKEEWNRYISVVQNGIAVLKGMNKAIDHNKPDRILAYNTHYSINHIVCKIGQQRGILTYFIHGGWNISKPYETLILCRDNANRFLQQMLRKWPEVKNKPCTSEMLQSVTDHFIEVTKGRTPWAYSSAANVNTLDLKFFFGVDDNRRVLTATMSSYDERFAAETVGIINTDNSDLIFPKQVDWILSLIDYVTNRDDVFLIIRVHPREFPNKREGVLSEHAKILQEVLQNLPSNVKVNWPTDNVSLYDLAVITDVFANGWSSTGKEMALLGIPVVLYSNKLVIYPYELNYVGTTKETYFSEIENALNRGWNPQSIRSAYRWCAMEYGYSTLDISDSYSKNKFKPRLSFFPRKIDQLKRAIVPNRGNIMDCRQRVPRLSVSAEINSVISNGMESVLDLNKLYPFGSIEEETIALKNEVLRMTEAIYGDCLTWAGRNPLADRLLKFANS